MARATRQDFTRFDGVEPSSGGALRIPAAVTRVGVLEYEDADGNRWGELRPRDEVFADASLATLRGAALTDLHPSELVTTKTWKRVAIGHVGDDVRAEGDYVLASVIVQDSTAVERVEAGERREVSCGYECDLDETPGVYEGVAYQRVQRSIRYNHLGLGPEGWGRAGPDVSLRMDGADVAARTTRLDAPRAYVAPRTDSGAATRLATNQEKITMAQKQQRRDGDESETKDQGKDPDKKSDAEQEPAMKADMVSPEEHQKALAVMQAKYEAIQSALAEAVKELSALKAAHEAEESAEVSEDDVPEAVVDSLVEKRLALRESARAVLGAEVKLDGLKAGEIRAKVIAHAMPTMRLDGLDAKAIDRMFDGIVEGAKSAAAKRADGKAKVASVLAPDAKQAEQIAREDGATRVDHSASLQQRLIDSGSKPLNAKVQ